MLNRKIIVGPVHGEELVVGLRVQHVRVGLGELHAHHQREQPGDEEEHERRVDVAEADALVVDAVEEAGDAGRVLPLRSSSSSSRCGLSASRPAAIDVDLLEVLEVRGDVRDLAVGQGVERRHQHARLDRGASRIHRSMFAVVFSIAPAPSVVRAPTSLRFGPIVPVASVPFTVWHPAHASRWNTT